MNRNKKASKIGTVAAVLASVILSGTTVFAYTPMQTVEDAYDTAQDSITFKDTDSYIQTASDYDIYFHIDDNTIIAATSTDLENRAILCSHNFKTGYADKHYSQSNGGCIVKTYTAKICMKCNHIVIGDYIRSVIYPTCPHK